MKKVDSKILSNCRCKEPGCHKRLKLNVILRHPDTEFCYKHWKLHKVEKKANKNLKIKNPVDGGAKSSSTKQEALNEPTTK